MKKFIGLLLLLTVSFSSYSEVYSADECSVGTGVSVNGYDYSPSQGAAPAIESCENSGANISPYYQQWACIDYPENERVVLLGWHNRESGCAHAPDPEPEPDPCPAESMCFPPDPGDGSCPDPSVLVTYENGSSQCVQGSPGTDPGDGTGGDGTGGDGTGGDGTGGDGTGGDGTGGNGTGGDGTGGDGTGGDGAGSYGDDRLNDESDCGIGLRPDQDGICRPIPDACGYVNGEYMCSQPEPPSGCGTIAGPDGEPISGCFEDQDGCGYFNGNYGCFDAVDDAHCAGGILINGICNKEDGPAPTQCPIGYVLQDGGCVNAVNQCPIGTSLDAFTGTCTQDDCPAGMYSLGGACLDIPPPPDPDNYEPPANVPPPDSEYPRVDLTSVNNRLDRLISRNNSGFSNAVNAANRTTSAVNNLNNTAQSILTEEKKQTSSLANITKDISDLSDMASDALTEMPDDADQSVVGQASADAQQHIDTAFSELESDLSSESPIQGPSGVDSALGDALPGYSNCTSVVIQMPGSPITLECEPFNQFKMIFGWVLYIWTLLYLIDLIFRPIESKV